MSEVVMIGTKSAEVVMAVALGCLEVVDGGGVMY